MLKPTHKCVHVLLDINYYQKSTNHQVYGHPNELVSLMNNLAATQV